MDLQTDQAKQWDLSDCRKHRSNFVGYELVLHLNIARIANAVQVTI